MGFRRAKIVCTLGPATDDREVLAQVIDAGMNVARLNFSHGSHQEHAERIERVREVSAELGRTVAILQDLCGPKIRCGRFRGGTCQVTVSEEVSLVEADRDSVAAPGEIPIQYQGLGEDLHPGDVVLLDDGNVALTVRQCSGGKVLAEVTRGGQLRSRVGVHLPAARVRIQSFTAKDREDLAFGLSQGVDYVALSFVRNAAAVQVVRDTCEAWGRAIPVVSKIETPQAIDHLEPIILASDAVMVARGDLGVELAAERVPVMQRRILQLARHHQRPVIVATEMMQSMIKANRPTRAEASDVATAVFDGTDAVMLSGETAMGDHPPLVVRTMHRIIVEAERSQFYHARERASLQARGRARVAEAIAHGACDIAAAVGAKVIVAFTESGRTAGYASGARPAMPIIGLSPSVETRRQLCLLWGVLPLPVGPAGDSDAMIKQAHALLTANGIVSPGDIFVTIFGAPVGVSGSTNAIQVRVVE